MRHSIRLDWRESDSSDSCARLGSRNWCLTRAESQGSRASTNSYWEIISVTLERSLWMLESLSLSMQSPVFPSNLINISVLSSLLSSPITCLKASSTLPSFIFWDTSFQQSLCPVAQVCLCLLLNVCSEANAVLCCVANFCYMKSSSWVMRCFSINTSYLCCVYTSIMFCIMCDWFYIIS